ncbi:ribose 5-phosphate isomerase B [Desulfonatronum thioautotrophicum]|uniref:ribose 5-phosphate isomerase B n=1 Tax=Desulfonatronum thioautotrophicum TaxID=617001 RepID=UPI000A45A2DB|nr:ribose 5-phosphate isomerase B [Desulfonatronum thioautotrophicum]
MNDEQKRIICIGSDHAGLTMKGQITKYLQGMHWEVLDVGTHRASAVDYPDIAGDVAAAVVDKTAQRAILICGSGVGASIAANKIKGIRAGLCHDTYSAHQGVEHDDMNVLCLGARVVGMELAKELVRAFLSAVFSGEERHVRRLEKIGRLELDGRDPNNTVGRPGRVTS